MTIRHRNWSTKLHLSCYDRAVNLIGTMRRQTPPKAMPNRAASQGYPQGYAEDIMLRPRALSRSSNPAASRASTSSWIRR